jgi:hypothetical protein
VKDRLNRYYYLAFVGKFACIANQIDKDLPQARLIANNALWTFRMNFISQIDSQVFLGRKLA